MRKTKLWIPDWLNEEFRNLTNHQGMHTFKGREEDLFVAAAILGFPKLKEMSAEDIIDILEEATLK